MKKAMPLIVGNDSLKQRLCGDILSDSLSHAYIIEGPDGSGRHTIALMAAAALACESTKTENAPLPCGTCASCKKILEKKSPDVIILGNDGKSSIGVDIARFIREDVHIIPNDLEHKIYIIENADKMTAQAQNALLLTLEEPPSFVHFFLLCNNADEFLETIRSRAPILRTERIDNDLLGKYICSNDLRAAQLKSSSPKEYEELVLTASGGIGKALELLDPKVWKPIHEMRSTVYDFVSFSVSGRGARHVLPALSKFSIKRDVLNNELLLLSDALRDLILLKKSDYAPLIFYSCRDEAISICDRTTLNFLFGIQQSVSSAIDANKRNANVRLLLLKMAADANLI